MRLLPKILTISACLVALVTRARADAPVSPPWASPAWSVESGILWEAIHTSRTTPLTYRLVPTQLSWRSARAFGWELDDGSQIIVRHRVTLLATWIETGPESHYIALDGSPSVEWWNKAGTSSLWGGAGGGLGGLDSQEVKGAQGQDFTLNWFLRGGLEHVFAHRGAVSAGVLFQHMSNGGQTNPNPSINALGFTAGYSWKY